MLRIFITQVSRPIISIYSSFKMTSKLFTNFNYGLFDEVHSVLHAMSDFDRYIVFF